MRREKTIVQMRILAKLYRIYNDYLLKSKSNPDLPSSISRYQLMKDFNLSNYKQMDDYMDKLVKAKFVKEDLIDSDTKPDEKVTHYFILEKGITFHLKIGKPLLQEFVDLF